MSMDDQGSVRIPLHIDTSQVESDLKTLDPILARLEQRLVRAFNGSDLVKGAGANFPRASSAAEVWTRSGRASPSVVLV